MFDVLHIRFPLMLIICIAGAGASGPCFMVLGRAAQWAPNLHRSSQAAAGNSRPQTRTYRCCMMDMAELQHIGFAH